MEEMESRQSCPLDPKEMRRQKTKMELCYVKEIENHVATSCDTCLHPPLNQLTFKEAFEFSTPLLLACHYGQFDSVQHILENWGVDVQQAGNCFMNPLRKAGTVDDSGTTVTPLFVAAFRGHVNIVRYLIERGADALAQTSSKGNLKYDGLTPLHGAFFNDHRSFLIKLLADFFKDIHDIVRLLLDSGADPSVLSSDGTPIWMRNIFDVDCVTELVNHGLDLNQRNQAGKTILHHFAAGSPNSYLTQNDCLDVVKLLVEKGADVMAQDGHGFTPILEAAYMKDYLVNVVVLNFLLERDDITLAEKIDALELAGAVILSDSKHATLLHLDKGYEYWRRALHLRMTEMDDGSRPYLLKTLFKLKNAERAVEWTTAEELKRVIQHPTEHAIQSTLVRLRIMSDKSCWAAAQTLFKDFFSHGSCPKKLKMQQRFIELLNFLWSLLEMIRRFDPHQTGVWSITVQIVETLVITLKDILLVNPQYLDLETIKTTLKLVVETDQVKFTDTDRIATNRGSHMGELLKLVKLLAALPPNITQNEDVKRYLFELVHTERRDERGRTLLHKACTDFSKDDAHLIVGTVRLILLAGANPNAGDADGPTQLVP